MKRVLFSCNEEIIFSRANFGCQLLFWHLKKPPLIGWQWPTKLWPKIPSGLQPPEFLAPLMSQNTTTNGEKDKLDSEPLDGMCQVPNYCEEFLLLLFGIPSARGVRREGGATLIWLACLAAPIGHPGHVVLG